MIPSIIPKVIPLAPEPVVIIGTGNGTIAATTPAGYPNLVVNFISPLAAILIRSVNSYLTILVGLIGAGMTSNAIPSADFKSLVIKCAGLAIAGAAFGLLKDLITVFGNLEKKYPLLTGSV